MEGEQEDVRAAKEGWWPFLEEEGNVAGPGSLRGWDVLGRRGELWRRVGRLDIQGTVEDQVALVAFPFAEGTEILEGARASLLEAPYLRFAGAWSSARRIGRRDL